MKLRLTGVHADFTGEFGVLSFVNGLSTTDVSALDGRRMATVVSCLTEDGKDPLDHGVDWGNTGVLVFVDPSLTRLTTVADQAKIDAAANPEPAPADAPPATWTRETLEAVADAKGIAGIREIAEPLGLKGASIKGLIDQILSGKTAVDDSQPNPDATAKV